MLLFLMDVDFEYDFTRNFHYQIDNIIIPDRNFINSIKKIDLLGLLT